MVRLRDFKPKETTMSFRFHREARNLVVTMLVAVAGALAAWALANFERESWIPAFFFLVACVLAIAATVLICWERKSEEPAKNATTVQRRVARTQDPKASAQQRKGASGKSPGP
jgi:apolipoprotein N-acyltransferase